MNYNNALIPTDRKWTYLPTTNQPTKLPTYQLTSLPPSLLTYPPTYPTTIHLPTQLPAHLPTQLPTHLCMYLLSYLPSYYLLAYSLTPCSTVLLEKLIGSQLVKKFPALYGTQRLILINPPVYQRAVKHT